jgi:hypothetical protein
VSFSDWEDDWVFFDATACPAAQDEPRNTPENQA